MPPRQQPVVQLTHQGRMQQRDSLGPLQKPHEAQGHIGHLSIGGIHVYRGMVAPGHNTHLSRQVGNDRQAQLQRNREVRRSGTGTGDLAHCGHIGRNQQRLAR